MSTDASALMTWIGLMTAEELAGLAASFDRLASYRVSDDREASRATVGVVAFLQALDALLVAEQQRRIDPSAADTTLTGAIDGVSIALGVLDRMQLQALLYSWARIARNREHDPGSSEPVQRFHTAIGDLLHTELATRLGS
jgi:hypothetical protein